MLRRIAVIPIAALILAHPSLTRVLANEAPVEVPPGHGFATATPALTVNGAPSAPPLAPHWTATPTFTATATPIATTDSAGLILSAATVAIRAVRMTAPPPGPILGRATPTPRSTTTVPPPTHAATPAALAVTIPAENFYWIGTAQVTMYTCVELGGCNYTASGLWPYEGIVAVDPRLIPLGATVWVDGLGIFLAADTGALIYGNRVDVYVTDYTRATNWGVQERRVAAYIAP